MSGGSTYWYTYMHTNMSRVDFVLASAKSMSVKWNLKMSVILTSVSFVRSLVVLDGRAASVLEIVALGGHQADGMAPPQSQHPCHSKESMIVIWKLHSAPLHRYQAHTTVSVFEPTNRAALIINSALQGDVVDTHKPTKPQPENQGFDDSNSEPYSIESPRDDIHQNHRTAYDFDDSIEDEFPHISNLYSHHHLLLLTDLALHDYNCVVEI
ncbi:hypothetical protein H257_14677 [Aphanomyces astaci]|uniref:Uncharacterized protein n=1 Tax=Aphanomyces astaci TaxID=112090 RepID=W4FS59_APHAT|nr:hypothetical protein H257_14677 [Aphanomyces astaci]ETV69654.1 hypothetical protein H257_14677 [Aphanomyces astaci]|eukprot:XP_009840870.1 hypothetical protein H257_14677 [Aphanomyces astaci]